MPFSPLKPSNSFGNIASIPWKAIYTTNYDDLVEKSYAMQHFFKCTVISPLSIQSGNSAVDIPLYKINGDINMPFNPEKPLVITLNDLRKNKKNNEKIVKQLMLDLNDTFIFLGYSFQDENEIITDILDEFQKNERWESIKEKYVILPKISDDIKLDLESYKITYIKGTADEFFDFISQSTKNDYLIKLNTLKKNFSPSLQNLNPQTLQYICEAFDVYEPTTLYPSDSNFFYRGGKANWGIIRNNSDISREIIVENGNSQKLNITTDTLYIYIQEQLAKYKLQKIKIEGPAISGKTTAIYRCAYDLNQNGILALIFKQQAQYKEGLLSEIYDKLKKAFVVLVDDIFIDFSEAIKMINEAENHNLPLLFLISTRYAEWENNLSNYSRNVLYPFDSIITMTDTFNKDEAQKFVGKLLDAGIIHINNKYEENSFIKKFERNNNIIEVLIELIDNNEIDKSISNEYDKLCPETKFAYGIVSLIYRYGFKTKWEILQRTLALKYDFSWEDFVTKILQHDAKGNLYDDEIQGNFYILGRHRYICEKIVQIHFEGNYSKEITALKGVITSCSGLDNDEYFIGGLIHAILEDKNSYYTSEQLMELLNFAIGSFENPKNCAFITHLKGEYYLRLKDFPSAIRCFDSNVQNDLNKEYSLHSLGKSYYYLAQQDNLQSGEFRVHIDLAIDKLITGITLYHKNEYYYALLISIFNYLTRCNKMSEKNIISQDKVQQLAIEYLGIETYNELLKDNGYHKSSME